MYGLTQPLLKKIIKLFVIAQADLAIRWPIKNRWILNKILRQDKFKSKF